MNALVSRFAVSLVACIAVAPASAGAATTVAIAQAAPALPPQAPLDHYFGKLAMSPLGVVNAIKLVNVRTDAGRVDAATAIDGLLLVEDAVKDWESQYPGDTWLPRVVLSIDCIYRKLDDDRARVAQLRTDAWLATRYPESDEAHSVIAALEARRAAVDGAYAAKTDPVPSVLRP